MCLCYLFSAKTAWQLVNRKADFLRNESILIDLNRELECSSGQMLTAQNCCKMFNHAFFSPREIDSRRIPIIFTRDFFHYPELDNTKYLNVWNTAVAVYAQETALCCNCSDA